MSKNTHKSELDDFWDDCIKYAQNKNKKEDKTNHRLIKSNSCVNFNLPINDNNINTNNKRKKNKLLKNHKLLDKILRTEESIPINMEKSKQKQIQILTALYNKDLLDKKRVNKEIDRLRKKIEKDELKDCSFKPKKKYRKNKSFDINYNKIFGKRDIYERDKIYKNHYKQKLKELQKELNEAKEEEENEMTTFKPEITYKNLKKVLCGDSEWEKKANNYSNKYFLWRYMKARKDESDKKKRLIWSMDKNNNNDDYDYNMNDTYLLSNNNKIVHRSISQKDSLLYKKSLHNSLMSFQTIDDSENIKTK